VWDNNIKKFLNRYLVRICKILKLIRYSSKEECHEEKYETSGSTEAGNFLPDV